MPELPDIPDGYWLEDAVAAGLQCGGNYVERSVTQNEDGAITLELDIIASRYGVNDIDSHFFEVKSGKWGFTDVFKIAGWMTFLEIDHAALFFSKPQEQRKQQRFDDVTGSLNITLIACPTFSHAKLITVLRQAQYVEDTIAVSEANIELWRWVYFIDRVLNNELRHRKLSGSRTAGRAIEYLALINDRVFFTKRSRIKAFKLYQGFIEYANLTHEAAEEIDPANSKATINEALISGRHFLIQSCLALQYRGRLGILKAAVDLVVETEDLDTFLRSLSSLVLPQTFRNAITELSRHTFIRRYPHFWQHFLWNWGGFIIDSRRDAEYQTLGEETGIPVDEIPNALKSFDILFPTNGGWFREIQGALWITKLFPAAYRGAGAFRRLTVAGAEEYHNLGLPPHVANTLVAWHNASAEVLTKGRLS